MANRFALLVTLQSRRAKMHSMVTTGDVRRGHRRIPARLEVEVVGPSIRLVGLTTNVSEGGAAVRLVGATPTLALNTEVEAKLRLPGQPTAVRMPARIAWWSDRGADGLTAQELGLQWSEGTSVRALEQFLGSFRFRVVVFEGGLSLSTTFDREVDRAADVVRVSEPKALWHQLTAAEVGLVVCPGSLEFVRPVLEHTEPLGTPVVVLSATVGAELKALLARQPRMVCQPEAVDPVALASLVMRLLDAATQLKENDRLAVGLESELKALREEKAALKSRFTAGPGQQLLGTSAAMQRVHEAIERLSGLDTTVLLVGETGTGKGVTARTIQKSSRRAEKPFITQNCAALPESLLDSELFGHARGAFTGAVSERAGLFEAASGGTVFLDELTEMSAAMQAKLLHVLQEGELRRVGSTQSVRVDVRVICATNQPLEPLVENGRFREDLYYRLAPFIIQLPPLRAHREDVAVLAAHFLAEFHARHGGPPRTLAGSAVEVLEQAPWPGNVRQLQHLMERLAITAGPNGSITAAQVRDALNVPTPRSKGPAAEALRRADETLDGALFRIEKQLVLEALEASRFVVTDAAQALGVNRSTLSRRLQRLGIKLPKS